MMQFSGAAVCSQFLVLGLLSLLLYPQSKQLPRISGMAHISSLPLCHLFHYCRSPK